MKKIFKYLLIILFVIILAATSIHIFMFKTLEKLYVKDNTNSSATTYFLHADTINAVWVNTARLELGLQYDNPFVKPIILFRDYLFIKGQEQLPKNSADDVIWWVKMNSKMYGFYGNDTLDNNLDINNLTKKELLDLRFKINENIIRFTTKKILFLKEKKFDHYLNILVSSYISILDVTKYVLNTNTNKKEHYLKNKYVLNEMETLYLHAHIIFDKNYFDNNKIHALFFKFKLLSKVLYSQSSQNKMKCDSIFLKEYLIYYIELGKNLMFDDIEINSKATNLLQNSFSNNKNTIDMYLINKIETECKQYKKEVTVFKKMIKQIGDKYGN